MDQTFDGKEHNKSETPKTVPLKRREKSVQFDTQFNRAYSNSFMTGRGIRNFVFGNII